MDKVLSALQEYLTDPKKLLLLSFPLNVLFAFLLIWNGSLKLDIGPMHVERLNDDLAVQVDKLFRDPGNAGQLRPLLGARGFYEISNRADPEGVVKAVAALEEQSAILQELRTLALNQTGPFKPLKREMVVAVSDDTNVQPGQAVICAKNTWLVNRYLRLWDDNHGAIDVRAVLPKACHPNDPGHVEVAFQDAQHLFNPQGDARVMASNKSILIEVYLHTPPEPVEPTGTASVPGVPRS